MAILKQKVAGAAVVRSATANYDDNLVVHRSGNEGIAGTKTFSESPLVPTVADTNDNSQKAASTAFVHKVFDTIYPVGSYAFGVMPSIGTWEEVVGDRALWLKNDAADGTEIEQALPNITGTLAAYSYNTSSPTGAFAVQSLNPNQAPAGGDTDRNFVRWGFSAASSNSIYKNGANVQPNAYVMKVYKRTA